MAGLIAIAAAAVLFTGVLWSTRPADLPPDSPADDDDHVPGAARANAPAPGPGEPEAAQPASTPRDTGRPPRP